MTDRSFTFWSWIAAGLAGAGLLLGLLGFAGATLLLIFT